MKTNLIRRDEDGAVMLTTALCIFAVITLLVVGYLWLLMGHSRRVDESQRWNQAMAVAEAGVEEAFAQLNWGPSPGRGDLSANGWGSASTATAGIDSFGPPPLRTISGGSYSSSFIAPTSITTNGAMATIYSTGMVTSPLRSATISRRIQVMATLAPLFPDAIDVVSNFTGNGSSVAVDSWDSSSTNFSTNGRYDSSKTTTNGNVGVEYGNMNLGQHLIDGNLYLGPDATMTSSPSNVMGSILTNDNMQFPDVQLPDDQTWQDAVASNAFSIVTNMVGGYPSYTTNSLGIIYNFTQSGSYRITVAGGVHPIQIAPNIIVNLDIQTTTFNPASVTILGGEYNSGTVRMYQESGTATLNTGTAGGYLPMNFEYYGLAGVTQVSLKGSSDFIGVIYAPDAQLTLGGGGSGFGLAGAIVVQNLTMNGNNYKMHYDQSLKLYGPSRGFVATAWREF